MEMASNGTRNFTADIVKEWALTAFTPLSKYQRYSSSAVGGAVSLLQIFSRRTLALLRAKPFSLLFFLKKLLLVLSLLRQIPEEYDMAFQPFLLCFPW